jgi:ribosomal protein S18 acetylase RimI-like enzyme
MSAIAVRRLTSTDAAQYRALRIKGLREFPHAFRSDYEEALGQPLEWAQARLVEADTAWFGAFDGAELVGALGMRTQRSAKVRHVAHLVAVIVDSSRHGRGIGSQLVAHLVAHARSLEYIRQIQLSVSQGNTAAEKLYDAFGFVPFGLERDAFRIGDAYYAKEHRQLMLS